MAKKSINAKRQLDEGTVPRLSEYEDPVQIDAERILASLRNPRVRAILRRKVVLNLGSKRSRFTLEYWKDRDWYVGQIMEVPGVMSQGKTLRELEQNIRDAYWLMPPKTVSIHEAKTRLSALLAQVAAGQQFTITKRGQPVAQLIPVE